MSAPNANTVANQSPYGYAVSWGIGNSATPLTITNLNILPQSTDNELTYDKQEVRDGRGAVVSVVFYNPNDSLTLEGVQITGTSSYDATTASIAYPAQGTMVSVSSIDSSDPISGSNWLIESVTVRRTNTDVTKLQFKMHRYQGIPQ